VLVQSSDRPGIDETRFLNAEIERTARHPLSMIV
jgi:hypothetical protein